MVGGLFLFSDEGIFKTKEYFLIGQWSAPVSVFLVLVVALLDRHIIQRLRKLQISELIRMLLERPYLLSKSGLIIVEFYANIIHKTKMTIVLIQ